MNIKLLKTLCETPGIASSEERVKDVIKQELDFANLKEV